MKKCWKRETANLLLGELRNDVLDYIGTDVVAKQNAIVALFRDSPEFAQTFQAYSPRGTYKGEELVRFVEYLGQEYGKERNPRKMANVLVLLINALYSKSKGQAVSPLTKEDLDKISRYIPTQIKTSSKRDADLAFTRTGEGVALTQNWVNSRLIFDSIFFSELAKVEGRNPVVDHFEDIVRPEDPGRGGPLKLGTNVNPANLFTFARDRDAKLFGMAGTVFGHPDLVRHVESGKRAPQGGRSAQEEREELQNALDVNTTGFEPKDRQFGGAEAQRPGRGILHTSPSSIGRIAKKHWLAARLDLLTKEENDEIRIVGMMAIFTRVSRGSLENWVDNRLPLPDSCYVLAQPWIRIRTELLLAYDSRGVGELLYGHEDVSNQYNNTTKVWLIHYTIWLGAGVEFPTRLIILPDARLCGYLGGMDANIYTNMSEFDPRQIDFERVKSGFCFSMGANFGRERMLKECNPMPLFGRHISTTLPYRFENRNQIFAIDKAAWPSFILYNNILGLTQINRTDAVDQSSFGAMRGNADYIVGEMYMGHHRTMDNDGKWTNYHGGTGHLLNISPPFRAALDGKVEFLFNRFGQGQQITAQ